MNHEQTDLALDIHPVAPERWSDLEALFGPTGAYSGCWCMYLRESSKQFNANAGAENRRLFHRVVQSGSKPGLLAYRGNTPIAWIAVAPRGEYVRVLRSPLHKPCDDASGVWAITCFFIARPWRGQGISRHLLAAAVAFARERGARHIEAYPIDTERDTRIRSQPEMWRGSAALFEQAGFACIARRKPGRPILRLSL